MKLCPICNIIKDNNQYSKSGITSDKLHSYCKQCDKDRKIRRANLLAQTKRPVLDNKVCNKCKVDKAIDQFQISSRHVDGYSGYCKECILRTPCRNKQHINELSRMRNSEIKNEVIYKYGGKCSWPGCTQSEIEFLCIDHINNNGRADRNLYGSGVLFYKHLNKQDIRSDLQVLCYNHNQKKAIRK